MNRSLQIQTPCTVPWDGMDALENGNRFCHSCSKVVHNLIDKRDEEIQAMFKASPNGLCGRIQQRIAIPMESLRKQAPTTPRRLGQAQIRLAASATALLMLSQVQAQQSAPLAAAQVELVDSLFNAATLSDGDSLVSDAAVVVADSLPNSPAADSIAQEQAAENTTDFKRYCSSPETLEYVEFHVVLSGMISTADAREIPPSLKVDPLPFDPLAPRSQGHVQRQPAKSHEAPFPYLLALVAPPPKRKRYHLRFQMAMRRKRIPETERIPTIMPWDEDNGSHA
jgi:hypothetical protein